MCALVTLLAVPAEAQATLPDPLVVSTGFDYFESRGVKLTRYTLSVINSSEYQNELFEPSPDLPPCGSNTSYARSWVDIYAGTGKRLNGFCALGGAADMQLLWFAAPRGETPPASVYIIINDRRLHKKLRSNLAPTGAPISKSVMRAKHG
jgi:hypothetical protein